MRYVAMIVLALAALQAWSEEITSWYGTGIYFRDCDLTTCDSLNQPPTAGIAVGSETGPAQLLDPAAGTVFEYLGSASAAAGPSGTLLTPELHAVMSTYANTFSSSQALALQRFENTGASPIQIRLNVDVDWTVDGYVPPTGFFAHGLVYALTIFENDSGTYDLDTSSGPAALNGANVFGDNAATLVDTLIYRSTSTFTSTGAESISSPLLNIEPGEGLFVATWLLALGGYGMTVDAFHTLSTSFVDENGQLLTADNTTLRPVVPPVEVAIDIKPGSESNCLNQNGHGVIPVAILGSADFIVADIDRSMSRFGGLEVGVRGNRDPMCSIDDVNDDGEWDLVCQFQDDADLWAPGEGEATLTGALQDGTAFEGSDSICIVPG